MKNNKTLNKPFSNPKWGQDTGAVFTGETFKLTNEEKNFLEDEDKKWQETLKKLKSKNKSTQK